MIKKIFIISISFIITSNLFSQDCDVDISDSIRPITIYNLGKQNFHHKIDATELYYNPVVFVKCWLKQNGTSSILVMLHSFSYQLYRNGLLVDSGTNNSDNFYYTPLNNVIKNTEAGDSLIFTNFNYTLNKLRNITLNPVSYKIVKNSIYKPDINHKKGRSKIYSYKKIKKFLEVYGSSCGSAPNYYVNKVPYYSDDSLTVIYPYKFIDYNGSDETIFQDISFVYNTHNGLLSVLNNQNKKEQSIEYWIKIIDRKLHKK